MGKQNPFEATGSEIMLVFPGFLCARECRSRGFSLLLCGVDGWI